MKDTNHRALCCQTLPAAFSHSDHIGRLPPNPWILVNWEGDINQYKHKHSPAKKKRREWEKTDIHVCNWNIHIYPHQLHMRVNDHAHIQAYIISFPAHNSTKLSIATLLQLIDLPFLGVDGKGSKRGFREGGGGGWAQAMGLWPSLDALPGVLGEPDLENTRGVIAM